VDLPTRFRTAKHGLSRLSAITAALAEEEHAEATLFKNNPM
jgi:hypothetical protein